jgi:hypothetical protein
MSGYRESNPLLATFKRIWTTTPHYAHILWSGLSPNVTSRILRINVDLLPKSCSDYLL